MEISVRIGHYTSTRLFKIDLIVWKSSIADSAKGAPSAFKIDLIVWKS